MEVIAAIATGSAATAIGIIRLSGDGSFDVADRVFRPINGTHLSDAAPRKMIYGDMIKSDGTPVDRGLAVCFPAPHSYTGENSVELNCHGSPIVLQTVLSALFAAGARQAKPGEFTKRAFLNGRMDLTQAEAVVDLIDAETTAAAQNAFARLGGSLRRDFDEIYNGLLDISSQFYAVVDYPDEDIEDLPLSDIRNTLKAADSALTHLLATCERGQFLQTGVPTVILGRPNAGKSSLLNALLGYDRAIVTSTAGTTRDTVEERAVVGGVTLRLVDTAGIRHTADEIEAMGVARAKQAAQTAALCLLVLDGSQSLTEEDLDAMDVAASTSRTVVIINKSDLPIHADLSAVKTRFPHTVIISAKTGFGLDKLEEAVAALFPTDDLPAGEILTDVRQQEAVSRARDAIRRADETLTAGLTPDVVLSDVEEALTALGELTGKTAREDVVSRIFDRFCVGK